MSSGHIVYQGDAAMSAPYMKSIGFKMPEFSNPADTYMRILSVRHPPAALQGEHQPGRGPQGRGRGPAQPARDRAQARPAAELADPAPAA